MSAATDRRVYSWQLLGLTAMLCGCGDGCGNGAVGDVCRGIASNAVRLCDLEDNVGSLVFTELMIDPIGADGGQEWFEIYNASTSDIELCGSLLVSSREDTTDSKFHQIDRSWTIEAGQLAVAGDRVDDPEILDTTPMLDYGYADDLGTLRNSTGHMAISCGNTKIDEIVYLDPRQGVSRGLAGNAWPPSASVNDDLAWWCDAQSEFAEAQLGTPGAPNDGCVGTDGTVYCRQEDGEFTEARAPDVGQLVITEVMADPDATPDEFGEWLEMQASVDYDLNAIVVGLEEDSTEYERVTTTQECVPVEAGARLLLAHSTQPEDNGGLPAVHGMLGGSLRNSDGHVWVGTPRHVVDTVTWGSLRRGTARSLHPDAMDADLNDDPAWWCDAIDVYGDGDLGTPGAPGPACDIPVEDGMCLDDGTPRAIIPPVAGDLVLNEWLPDSAVVLDAQGEWFEVYVAATVDLNGLELHRFNGDGFVLADVLDDTACREATAGSHLVFARVDDPRQNGGLPGVDVQIDFTLANLDGGLAIGYEGVMLDEVTWLDSTPGAATSLDPGALDPSGNDDPSNLCPASTPYGPGDNNGSPGATNPECR